jgi:hypothetical protein
MAAAAAAAAAAKVVGESPLVEVEYAGNLGNVRKEDEAAAAVGADIGADDDPPSCSEHESTGEAHADALARDEAAAYISASGCAPAARIWSDVRHLVRPLPPRRCEHTRSRKSSSGRLASCDSDDIDVGDGDLIDGGGGVDEDEDEDGRGIEECDCGCKTVRDLGALVENINGCDIGDSPKIDVRVGSGDGVGVKDKSPRGVNEIGRLDATSGEMDGQLGDRVGASSTAGAGGGGVKIDANTVWT